MFSSAKNKNLIETELLGLKMKLRKNRAIEKKPWNNTDLRTALISYFKPENDQIK